MKSLRLILIGSIFITFCSFVSVSVFQPRWAIVGTKAINFKQDQENIPLKLAGIPLTTIRLGFEGGKINMHHITIHFENGEVQTVPMKKIFKSGNMSRIIDLKGAQRKISRVKIYYRPDHLSKQNVTVELWAKIDTKNKPEGN